MHLTVLTVWFIKEFSFDSAESNLGAVNAFRFASSLKLGFALGNAFLVDRIKNGNSNFELDFD